MNYNEFTSYLADRIVGSRNIHPLAKVRRERFYDAGYKAVLDCRAFFDRFSLDEGPHNDYNPTSRDSVESYRMDMYKQIAIALGNGVAAACEHSNESFLNFVLRRPLPYGKSVTDRTFAQVAAEHVSNLVFERVCAGCGAKYKVALNAQTYRMISNDHPATCVAVRTAPVVAYEPELNIQVEEGRSSKLERILRDLAQNRRLLAGPSIPADMLTPKQKPAFKSPEYLANTKAALRLYADFLKFYEENPLPESDPEENQRQMERIFAAVMRTVFNFESDALKKKQ